MVSFITPPPRGLAQALRSSEPDCYETLMANGAAAAKGSPPRARSPDCLPSPSIRASTASSSKRKKYSANDEVADNSSIQQSPARKKRTLWDGSLSRDAETGFVPPSTPPKRPNDCHIEAPPDTPPSQYGLTATPTPQSKLAITVPGIASKSISGSTNPPDIPPPTACGHSIHPAYSDIYAKAMCPMCLVDASMNGLQSMQNRINARGGLSEWHENQTSSYDHYLHMATTTGGKKKKGRPDYRNANGTDISYRHRKRNLLNLVTELETLSEMEVIWEEKQLPENNDVHVEQVRLRKQYSATAALHWYGDTVGNGFIGRIEEDCEFFSRRRGRRWMIANDPKFPDRAGHEEQLKWKVLTKAQKKCFMSSRIPLPRKFDTADLQPTRKRRHEGAGVSFNEEVYVRTDADVDVLRKAASSLSEEFLEPAPKKPRMSVLRTAPLKPSEAPAPLKIGPKPTRPHYVVPLSRKDGPPRDTTKGRMHRKPSGYRRGQWAVPEGSELIDTSGKNRNIDNHLAIVDRLRWEAAIMDNEDPVEELEKSVEDTEMKDAPVAEPEATPQPSFPSLPSLSFGGRLLGSFASHWFFAVFGTP